MLQSLIFKQGLLVSEEKTEKEHLTETQRLAKMDTAIEIMAA